MNDVRPGDAFLTCFWCNKIMTSKSRIIVLNPPHLVESQSGPGAVFHLGCAKVVGEALIEQADVELEQTRG